MKKITLCLMLVFANLFLSAQAIIPDSNFGVDGLIATGMYDSYGNPYGNNMAILPNGEVAVVGIKLDSNYLPAVMKFGNNGAFDTSFTRVFPNLNDNSLGLSVQGDGKLLVTGHVFNTPGLSSATRLNIDGSLDASFGIGGTSSFLIYGADNMIPMEISTGKIIVFGDETPPNSSIDAVATRLHSNGAVDTTFAVGGYFRFGLPNQFLLLSAGLEQPDGKLLFAGMANWDLFMYRLHPDGTFDDSFGTNGYLIDPMPTGGEAYSLDLQADGKIVVCGYAKPSYQSIAARYHPNGTRDTTFGEQGVLYFNDIPAYTEGIGIEVLPNGNTLVGISSFYAEHFYIAQLLLSGERDTTFGVNGVYKYLNKDFRARVMSRSGNILTVSGREESSGVEEILLLRFILDLNVGTLNPNVSSKPHLLVYPNPIAEPFTLQFGLSQKDKVSVSLFDMQGKLVEKLVENQFFEQGEHEVSLNCPGYLPSGNYVLCLEVAGKKMASIQITKV